MGQDELLERLLAFISELGPDQRIPAERQLGDEWGVSRGALRHRLRLLEAMGVLERRGSAGTFTKTLQPSDVATILRVGLNASELADPASFRPIRAALEIEASLLAARNAAPVPVAYIEEAVLAMEAADDLQTMYEADLDFHRALFKACGDPGLQFFYAALQDLVVKSVSERRIRMYTLAADVELMRTLHRNILVAIQSHDEDAAVAAMRDHFDRIDLLRPASAGQSRETDQDLAALAIDTKAASIG